MVPAALGTIVSQRLVAANRQARACNAPDDQSMSDRRYPRAPSGLPVFHRVGLA
jgi:hypothetical protein